MAQRSTDVRPSWWRTALAGLLAAGSALAFGELVAGFSSRLSAPVIAVGDRVIDAVPRQVKDLAISWFGTNDKVALLVGIAGVVAVLGLAVGIAGGRRFVVGAAGIVLFGAVGVWAAGQAVGAPWWAGVPSVAGALVGIGVLGVLEATIEHADAPAWGRQAVARLGGRSGETTTGSGSGSGSGPDGEGASGPLARRAFLRTSAAAVVVAGAAAAGGRWLRSRYSAAASRASIDLPKADKKAPAVPEGAALEVDGISPYITPNADFYRIDTNLTVPQIPADTWRLKVTGMVDHDLELTYDDITGMDLIEERITMTCVSNEIGGGLVGNARWLGVPLADLLKPAGVHDAADQVVGRAFDGFTTGFPTDILHDGRPAMLAIGMNGRPLPLVHGFPARLIVPGLYGYVSATKWLTEIELTTFADFDQYWVKRDWSADGTIKTMSRIDTPGGLQHVSAGRVPVAGVAWAQTRGIERVEVRIDDGPWHDAELASEDSDLTWRQWRYDWDATGGRHQITCRATDGDGHRQTEKRARPFPDGASGWHSIAVLVD